MQKHPAVIAFEKTYGQMAVTAAGYPIDLIPDDDQLPKDSSGNTIYPALESTDPDEQETARRITIHGGPALNLDAINAAVAKAEAAAKRAEDAKTATEAKAVEMAAMQSPVVE